MKHDLPLPFPIISLVVFCFYVCYVKTHSYFWQWYSKMDWIKVYFFNLILDRCYIEIKSVSPNLVSPNLSAVEMFLHCKKTNYQVARSCQLHFPASTPTEQLLISPEEIKGISIHKDLVIWMEKQTVPGYIIWIISNNRDKENCFPRNAAKDTWGQLYKRF